MSLDFLKQIKVEDVPQAKSSGGRRKEWNPTLANAIRVWNTGKVFPSAALVERFSLEYGNKPAEKQKPTGNAIDVFNSEDFPVIKGLDKALVFANITPKAGGKTDLFGSTSYNEDGTPKATVMEQGNATFGKDSLIPLINDVYGIEVAEGGFVDLVLLGIDGEAAQQPFTLPNGKTVCYIPKAIARGDKQGEMSTVRRENPILFVLYPASMLESNQSGSTELVEETETAAVEAAAVLV